VTMLVMIYGHINQNIVMLVTILGNISRDILRGVVHLVLLPLSSTASKDPSKVLCR
jgi:hypothetical protein